MERTLSSSRGMIKQIDSVKSRVRPMRGIERLLATAAKNAGFGHLFMGYHVVFNKSLIIPPENLRKLVRSAWLRTRFMAPWIALKASKHIDLHEPNSWVHGYETYSDVSLVVTEWANKTLFWSKELRSLHEWKRNLTSNYWSPDDNRFGMELHLAEAPQGDTLSYGRGSLHAIDLFFKNLRSEVLSADVSVNHLPWGEEITRVSPPTIDAIAGLTGPRSVDDNTLPAGPIKQKEITFERPTHSVVSWEERPSPLSDIRLTRAETATFHHICRERKANSTAVLNGIYILADIETVLYCARRNRKEGPSDYDRALEAYESADVYIVNENMADRRSLLSRTIPSVSSPGGFGNNVCEVFQTKHSMRHIRGCLSVEYDGTCRINLQSPHFWSGMVIETEAQMTAMKKTTPDRFAEAERQAEILSAAFKPEEYFKPGVLLTSIGRLSSLKLFDDFLPIPTSSSPFLILDIALGISASGPDVKPVALMTWEYDNKLNIHLCGSAKWHDEDEWSFFEKCVRTSLNKLLKSATTKL